MRRWGWACLCGVSLVIGVAAGSAGDGAAESDQSSPEVRLAVAPVYPDLAVAARLEVDVELEAEVAEDGALKSIAVTKTHPLFERVALAAAKQWRFAATPHGGRAHMTFAFRLLPYDTPEAEAATRFYPPHRIEVRAIPIRPTVSY